MSSSINYDTKVLEVKNLRQHFKVGVGKNKLKVRAVDDVSFDIYKKEVFGLVGESGCGKTTTGRSIMRLYRPTNGQVVLNGNIIGSGSDDLKQLLKVMKHEEKIELLKLDDKNYQIYKIKEKFNVQIKEQKDQIEKIKNELKKGINDAESAVTEYKKQLFDEKESYGVELDKLLFAYRVDKDKLEKQKTNPAQHEYDSLIKGLNEALKKKLEGIKESAALSKEAKQTHQEEIRNSFAEKLNQINEEMMPKIELASQQMISKEEYKRQINELNERFVAEKNKLKSVHTENLGKIHKPDYSKIKTVISNLKNQNKEQINTIDAKIRKLKEDMQKEISQVSLSSSIDLQKKKEITSKYNDIRIDIINQIKQSKTIQKSKEAEKNVKEMQMIFQDPISSLNPRMTVQEIVSEGLVINGIKDKDYIQQKVIETLELVGLAPEYISRYPHEFSGGQRQRIGIARALIMNPTMIIADEPISALDVSIKAQVINLLSELRDKLDLSILFIAHDLSVVKFFCDRIAVMYFGQIVELATSEELFKNPLHGYTKSLLSAIPHPDPDSEKKRVRIPYSPAMHDYREDKPQFVEVIKGHFIRANSKELNEIKKKLGVENDD